MFVLHILLFDILSNEKPLGGHADGACNKLQHHALNSRQVPRQLTL